MHSPVHRWSVVHSPKPTDDTLHHLHIQLHLSFSADMLNNWVSRAVTVVSVLQSAVTVVSVHIDSIFEEHVEIKDYIAVLRSVISVGSRNKRTSTYSSWISCFFLLDWGATLGFYPHSLWSLIPITELRLETVSKNVFSILKIIVGLIIVIV